MKSIPEIRRLDHRESGKEMGWLPTRWLRLWLTAVTLGVAMTLLAPALTRADAQKDYDEGVAAHNRGDVIAAIDLLRRAVAQGHVKAMVRLGYVLDKAEENEEAFQVYSRAAATGNADAALAVGLMYAGGEGVEKNPTEALKWIPRAAEGGNGSAVITLAYVHLRGDLGVSPNREEAIRWLKKGIAAGYLPAQRELEFLQRKQPARNTK